jgi:hypothetical protein
MLKPWPSSKDALKYFWEYAEPNSKLARERYYTTNPGFESNITTGGSGFGLMTIIAGVDRGFVPRAEAVPDWQRQWIFLKKSRAFSRRLAALNGNDGKVIPLVQKTTEI